MRRTDRVLFGTGVAAVLTGAWIALAPGTVPVPVERLGDENVTGVVGIALGIVVVVVAAARVWYTGSRTLDRSTIADSPPEQVQDGEIQTTADLDGLYRRLDRQFENAGRAERYTAVYGRRAVHSEDVTDRLSRTTRSATPRRHHQPQSTPTQQPQRHQPQSTPTQQPQRHQPQSTPTQQPQHHQSQSTPTQQPQHHQSQPTPTQQPQHHQSQPTPTQQPQRHHQPQSTPTQSRHQPRRDGTTSGPWGDIGVFLDDIAALAGEAYATATGCDRDEAGRAVDTGTWTDDRVAAAFLAADADAAPAFTTRERVVAWLLPRQTLERRLDRAVAAIDTHAGAFLTYEDRTETNRDRRTGRASTGGEDQ